MLATTASPDRATAERIAAAAHAEPELLITTGPGQVCGAVWSHVPVSARVEGLAQHAIALHLSGCTLVEKWCGGRLQGHHSRVGSVTLVPAQVASDWVLSGHSRVAHLYIDPARLAQAAASADGPGGTPLLRDFYAQNDEVTASVVRLLLAQAHAGTLDELAHDQAMALLLRHLLQRYAADAPLAANDRHVTLTAATLRRLFEHIESQIGSALRLAELAALARLSEDHFLRAFKAAVGQTPHQYVLGRRIAHTQTLLEHSRLPIAEVALAAGFRGPSHFAAAFRQRVGSSPRAWRAQRGVSEV
jgi:AraC family transcriptional regulator